MKSTSPKMTIKNITLNGCNFMLNYFLINPLYKFKVSISRRKSIWTVYVVFDTIVSNSFGMQWKEFLFMNYRMYNTLISHYIHYYPLVYHCMNKLLNKNICCMAMCRIITCYYSYCFFIFYLLIVFTPFQLETSAFINKIIIMHLTEEPYLHHSYALVGYTITLLYINIFTIKNLFFTN